MHAGDSPEEESAGPSRPSGSQGPWVSKMMYQFPAPNSKNSDSYNRNKEGTRGALWREKSFLELGEDDFTIRTEHPVRKAQKTVDNAGSEALERGWKEVSHTGTKISGVTGGDDLATGESIRNLQSMEKREESCDIIIFEELKKKKKIKKAANNRATEVCGKTGYFRDLKDKEVCFKNKEK